MKTFSKCASALVAIVLLAGMASAADTISSGKVKAVRSGKKEFVLTDGKGKNWTIKLGANVVINHGGKESKSDLKAGEAVNSSLMSSGSERITNGGWNGSWTVIRLPYRWRSRSSEAAGRFHTAII